MDVAPSTKTILRYKTYNDTHTTNYSLSNCFIQVYLVTGGYNSGYLSSTEIYEGGKWTEVGALPAAVFGVRGASLQNTVYMMGKGSVMTGVLLIICSQVALAVMSHHDVMISGSLMPTQSSGRGLTKCQRQELSMPCPLWQTRILQDIVIILKYKQLHGFSSWMIFSGGVTLLTNIEECD